VELEFNIVESISYKRQLFFSQQQAFCCGILGLKKL